MEIAPPVAELTHWRREIGQFSGAFAAPSGLHNLRARDAQQKREAPVPKGSWSLPPNSNSHHNLEDQCSGG